jgi:GDPmannose 4,6-dehydratase
MKDWSHSSDFMDGIWRMLNQKKFAGETFRKRYCNFCDIGFTENWKPSDYILASGETHSVRQFLAKAFYFAGMENSRWVGHGGNETLLLLSKGKEVPVVKISQKFYRPLQTPLKGDSSPIREQLGWEPKISFHELIKQMVETDLNK